MMSENQELIAGRPLSWGMEQRHHARLASHVLLVLLKR
jgi:hypothetical protein